MPHDDRLVGLELGDQEVLAGFSLHPGQHLDAEGAAAITGTTLTEARNSLDRLVAAGLVVRRYSLPDPSASLPQRLADTIGTDSERREKQTRLIGRYLQVLADAQRSLNPGRWYLGRALREPARMTFTQRDAVALVTGEIGVIEQLQQLAAEVEQHDAVWEIAEALTGYFVRRRCFTTALRIQERGVEAARTVGDRQAEALMHIALAHTHLRQRHYGSASSNARRGFDLAKKADKELLSASGLEALGLVDLARRDLRSADETLKAARQMHVDLDRQRGAAIMTRHLGSVAAGYGDDGLARERFRESLRYFTQTQPDRYHEMRCRLLLARLERRAGKVKDATEMLATVLDLAHTVAAPVEQASALVELADISHTNGERLRARQYRQEARTLYQSVGAPQASDMLVLIED